MAQMHLISLLQHHPEGDHCKEKYECMFNMYVDHGGLFMVKFKIESVKEMLRGANAPAVVVQQFKRTGYLPHDVSDRVKLWLQALDNVQVNGREDEERRLYLKGLIFMAGYELINSGQCQ